MGAVWVDGDSTDPRRRFSRSGWGWKEGAGHDEELRIDQREPEDWPSGHLWAVTPSVHGTHRNVLS